MLKEIVLWSAELCPFAHRARLVLREKKVEVETKEVDLGNKSEEFKAVYRKALFADPYSDGKVPTIEHKDIVMTESEPIVWYIAETFKGGAELIPESPIDRARLRYFAGDVGPKVISAYHGFAQYHKNLGKQKEIVEIAAQTF